MPCDVAAIDERHVVRAYGREVRWRIRQGTPEGYVGAARAIAASNVDVVCVQHEFGLYGLWHDEAWEGERWIEGTYEDHLTPFLRGGPQTHARDDAHRTAGAHAGGARGRAARSPRPPTALVVMAESAVEILDEVYGVSTPASVIQHGMPHIEPNGRRRLKDKLGLDGRPIVSTFGLVGSGQGTRVRDRGDARGRRSTTPMRST